LDRINEGLESDKLLILVATIVDEAWDKLFSKYSVSLHEGAEDVPINVELNVERSNFEPVNVLACDRVITGMVI
jgi:hypothetical protein